jgi:small subunit ribosomal protein S20
MPNIQSAKKKMRKDVKRTKNNAQYLTAIEKAVKALFKFKTGEVDSAKVKKTVSLIDKAAKRKVVHKNKAARLKSRISKLSSKKK